MKHFKPLLISQNKFYEKQTSIVTLRSDHGGEFENFGFEEFCKTHGIKHEFSSPRTPQQMVL